jgi:hypothetical protein
MPVVYADTWGLRSPQCCRIWLGNTAGASHAPMPGVRAALVVPAAAVIVVVPLVREQMEPSVA